ncbi:MAG TPA: hypothetical protein VN774_06365 [Candidatus Limnocylindrales bacterium]|nr:hypothetical protein [Candidatus Limnocylindrales bacterium]
MRRFLKFMMAGTVLAMSSAAIPAQQGPAVTVTVTAMGKDKSAPPPIPANEVVVRVDNKVRPIVSWVPSEGGRAGLDLAIVVDDSITPRAADRWSEMQSFVRSLPVDTRVGVAYANYGATHFEQDFTANHEQAAKAFRIPAALSGSTNGTFDAVRDLIKKWPATPSRREILLISSGIDLDNGVSDTDPNRNMELQSLIDEAERSGIVVYTIYASTPGPESHNAFLVMNGQGCLGRLAAETGGDAFFQGLETPVSFQPFLDEIHTLLGQQYLLTFYAEPRPKPGFSHLKVVPESHSIQLIAPDHVYISGGGK